MIVNWREKIPESRAKVIIVYDGFVSFWAAGLTWKENSIS